MNKSINSGGNDNTINNAINNTINSNNAQIDLVTKVVIERFPSRNEILKQLDQFLIDNNLPKEYQSDNKDNVLTIIFKQFEVAVAFCKYINIEKLSNKLYSKVKAVTVLDEVKKKKSKNLKSSLDDLSQERNKCHLHNSGSCPMMQRYRIYKSVIASAPFIEKCEKIKEERRKNKEKWLQGKNFNSFIGKASLGKLGYINNYVARDVSIPNHIFQSKLRASNKYTWVNPKGFLP